MSYSEKLKDPRWQRLRLLVFQAADWACLDCSSTTKELHAHHKRYRPFRDPWDYPISTLASLCHDCHDKRHAALRSLHSELLRASDNPGNFIVDQYFIYAAKSDVDGALTDLETRGLGDDGTVAGLLELYVRRGNYELWRTELAHMQARMKADFHMTVLQPALDRREQYKRLAEFAP